MECTQPINTFFSELGKNGGVLAIETGYADMTPGEHRQEHTH